MIYNFLFFKVFDFLFLFDLRFPKFSFIMNISIVIFISLLSSFRLVMIDKYNISSYIFIFFCGFKA